MMANRDFLLLGLNQRLKFIHLVNQYFANFSSNFSLSLNHMFRSEIGNNKVYKRVLMERISDQLDAPVEIQIRYFNRNKFTMTGAVYLPKGSAIYLNLNEMVRSAPDFIDSFEHELWHHLLPLRDKSGKFVTLWFEGFTETVSEIWSESFNKSELAVNPSLRPAKTIQYPVQTAFVSLYFGVDKLAALSYFSGILSEKKITHSFAWATTHSIIINMQEIMPLSSMQKC